MATDPSNSSKTIQAQINGQLQPRPLPERRRSRLWTISIRTLFAVPAFGAAAAAITLSIYIWAGAWFPLDSTLDQEYCGIGPGSTGALIAPDMTFGNLTIMQAKAIDLSWNLVAGRGLQGILGFISYRVGTGALLRIAERIPISLELFKTMALYPSSLSSIIPLVGGFIRTSGWRARTTLMFLLLSTLFMIAFPTLSDITTGYIQTEDLYGQYSNGTLFRMTLDIWVNCSYTFTLSSQTSYSCATSSGEPPTLICVPQSGYQWGFSSYWVTIILCLIFVWAFGMYGIWVDASRHSIQLRKGRTMGTWRAIADLGGAIDHELGSNLSTYSDAELKKSLNAVKPVMYTVKQDTEQGLDQIVLSSDLSMETAVSLKDATV